MSSHSVAVIMVPSCASGVQQGLANTAGASHVCRSCATDMHHLVNNHCMSAEHGGVQLHLR